MRWNFGRWIAALANIFWILRFAGPVPHDVSYYSKCMLGGALACGVTHAGITPLDVAKCNMQVRHLDRLFECLFVSKHSPLGEPHKIQGSW